LKKEMKWKSLLLEVGMLEVLLLFY
jgi:hypothetical protein